MMRWLRTAATFKNWPLHYLNRRGWVRRPRVELVTRDGLRLTARTGTSDFRTSRSVLVDRSYFHGCDGIPPDSVIVDIGGHIGCFTLLASRMAPQARIFTYEPDAANFEILEENIRKNLPDRAKAFNMAVAGKEEERLLNSSPKASTTGGHSLIHPGVNPVAVRCTTLEAILSNNGLEGIDFLKLDCEGAEQEILEACPPETLRKVKRGAMEVDHKPEMCRLLKERGFRTYDGDKPNYLYFVAESDGAKST